MQVVKSIGHFMDVISGGTALGKATACLSALLVAYFTPIVGLLITCFAFTTVDLIYGLKVAKRQRQKITSEKGWKGTLKKLLDEFTIISLARLLEFTVLGHDGVFVLTGGVTVIIALTELWSILENLNTLDPNGPWRGLGKFLQKKGEDYVGVKLKEEHDKHSNDNNAAAKV